MYPIHNDPPNLPDIFLGGRELCPSVSSHVDAVGRRQAPPRIKQRSPEREHPGNRVGSSEMFPDLDNNINSGMDVILVCFVCGRG